MMKGKNDRLEWGTWNALCDRCGFKFKANDMLEEWQGLMVCKDCYEPRHPQDFLRGIPDDPSVPWARLDDNGGGGTDINGDAIPETLNTDVLTDVPDGTNDGSL